MIRGRKKFID